MQPLRAQTLTEDPQSEDIRSRPTAVVVAPVSAASDAKRLQVRLEAAFAEEPTVTPYSPSTKAALWLGFPSLFWLLIGVGAMLAMRQ